MRHLGGALIVLGILALITSTVMLSFVSELGPELGRTPKQNYVQIAGIAAIVIGYVIRRFAIRSSRRP